MPTEPNVERSVRQICACLTTVALIAAAIPTRAARADGVAFKSGRDASLWAPLREREQLAAIHFERGVQRMVLAIHVELADVERAAWIFPVRGRPDDVQIDVLDAFPHLGGADPRAEVRSALRNFGRALRAWTLVTVPFELIPTLSMLGSLGGVELGSQVDKHGLHAETIAVASVDAIAEHLARQNVGIDASALSSLAPYCNDQHTLVVVWVASADEVRAQFPGAPFGHATGNRWPCVFVRFPTVEPFFPLRPTSAYGDEVVPLRLYLIGLCRPADSGPWTSQLDAEHYRRSRATARTVPGRRSESAERAFTMLTGGMPGDGVDYTVITGAVPANQFTHDLTFTSITPPGWTYASFLQDRVGTRGGVIAFAAGLFVLSYLSGGVTGLLMFRRWSRPSVLGAHHVFTLVGLLLVLRREKLTALQTSPPTRSESALRRWFVVSFVAVYVLLTMLIGAVVAWPLG